MKSGNLALPALQGNYFADFRDDKRVRANFFAGIPARSLKW
jgi:hypothetical protein